MQTLALTVIGIMAAVILLYMRAKLWPYVPCSKCGGTGKRMSPNGEAYGRCRKCKDGPKKERRRLTARMFGTGR